MATTTGTNDTSINSGSTQSQSVANDVASGQSNTLTQNNNVYAPGAAAGQQAGTDELQQILQGGSPGANYGLTQQAYDAAQTQFNTSIAPELATQYGAGSPTIANALLQQNENLAAQSSQMGWGNLNDMLSQVKNLDYTPVGNVASGAQSQAQAGSQATDQNSSYSGSSLDLTNLLSGIGSILSGFTI